MNEVPRQIPRLGRYTDLTLLGQGGMGAVYRGRDPSLDREVAVKLMHDRSADFVARFRREARAIAKLSHPHIVQVYDFGESEDGSPYFVMELLAGQSLQDMLTARGRLAVPLVIAVLRQAAMALSAAHQAGIVHRDIKPANLVLSGSVLKLVDFGVARIDEGGAALTQTAGVVGTPLYMAPEVLSGQQVDGRADIYALGLTAYHLLSGKPPFLAPTAVALAMKQLSEPMPDLTQEAPGTPVALCRLIARMAEKDRNARIQDGSQLLHEIGAIAEQLDAAPTGRSRRDRWAVGAVAAVGVLLVLLVGGAAAWTLMPAPAGDPRLAHDDRGQPPPPVGTPAKQGDGTDLAKAAHAQQDSAGLRVAVLKFKNLGGDPDLDFLTEGIGETALTELSRIPGVQLIERNQVDQALHEIDFGQTKYVDKATAAALGRIAGAQVAIQGGYQRSGGQIRVTARLVSIASGEILDTLALTRPARSLFDVQDAVSAALREHLVKLAATGPAPPARP